MSGLTVSPVLPTVPTGGGRINALTGLRFVAALAVYISHYGLPEAPGWLDTFAAAGYDGVTVFFVLSGFVLTHTYGDEFRRWSRETPIRLWNFGVARFARVYPLYLAVLLVVWGVDYGGTDYILPLHLLALQPWVANPVVALGYNSPGWSIGVEVFLYVCFPLVALVAMRAAGRPRVLLSAAALVALAMVAVALFFVERGWGELPWSDPRSAHRWLYLMPLGRLGDFTLGVLGALLLRHAVTPRRPRRAGADGGGRRHDRGTDAAPVQRGGNAELGRCLRDSGVPAHSRARHEPGYRDSPGAGGAVGDAAG